MQILSLRDLPAAPAATTASHLLDVGAACPLACPGCTRTPSGRPALDHAARTLLASARGGPDDVRAVLYGGDPFLAAEGVASLLAAAGDACAARGARLLPLAIASGAAMSASSARTLRGAGLAALEVALDGTRERHDRLHPRAGGGGSWDPIVGALRDERAGIPAVVRMAADDDDPEVARLAEALGREGLLSPASGVLLAVGPPATYRERACELLRLAAAGLLPGVAAPRPDPRAEARA